MVQAADLCPGAAGRLARLWPVTLCALLVAGCDPSPASRALHQPLPAAATEPAAAEVVEPAPVMIVPDEPPAPDSAGQLAGLAVVDADEAPTVDLAGPFAEMPEPEPHSSAVPGGSLRLLGEDVLPGTSRRLQWSPSEVFEGMSTETPVLVVNGREEGPTLCLTAAIHGDELNGIEMVRRVIHDVEPESLRGAIIGIPIVNLQGFRRGSRYLPDRRDLNRYFPGNPLGSSAARIAHSLFEEIIRECDSLVDLHTGSFYRTNLPQLRADLRHRRVRQMTQGFGGMVVLHSVAAEGTLRRAATDAGIPAVTLEAGEPLRLQSSKVGEGVTGIFSLLTNLEMIRKVQLLGQAEPVFYDATWIRADHGGILFSVVRLGQMVQPGDVLGTVTDPITNEQNLIYSSARGRVLGMALNQVVMPGFAAFRIGIETDGPPSDSVLAALEWGRSAELGDSETEDEASLRDTESDEADPTPADDAD